MTGLLRFRVGGVDRSGSPAVTVGRLQQEHVGVVHHGGIGRRGLCSFHTRAAVEGLQRPRAGSPCPGSRGARRSGPGRPRSRNCPMTRMPHRSWLSTKCSSKIPPGCRASPDGACTVADSTTGAASAPWRVSVDGPFGGREEPVPREGIGPLGPPRLVSSGEPWRCSARYGHLEAPTSLLIRIDPRDRGGLQRQIYGSIRRAILEGVSRRDAPALVAGPGPDLGRFAHHHGARARAAGGRGLSDGAPGSGTFVAHDCPTISRGPRAQPARGPAPAALAPRERPRRDHAPRARRSRARRAPFRIGVPALDLFPVRSGRSSPPAACARVTPSQLDYGDAGGSPRAARGHRRPRRTARGTRCGADQVLVVAGAQQGIDLPAACCSTRATASWMEEPGYPGRPQRARRRGRALVPVPVDARGHRRRGGRPARRRRAPRLRDAVAPVPARRAR